MAEIKKLQVDGADIYPVTHESAVYDSEGKSIEFKYISSVPYTEGDDISIEGSEGGSDERVGELNNLQTTNKNTLVDAINELFQSANNGKQLIADAIGSPLDASDTFSAMSNDINSLLSIFKTNMMISGAVVESGDKFKQLIDKIVTLSESEDNSLQYATGVNTSFTVGSSTSGFQPYSIGIDIDFEPTVVYVFFNTRRITRTTGTYYSGYCAIDSSKHYSSGTATTLVVTDYYMKAYYDKSTNQVYIDRNTCLATTFNGFWVAIGGVGESSSEGLNIISASELPATGKDNQICIIMDDPIDSFRVTSDLDDVSSSYVTIGLGESGTSIPIVSGNITTIYTISTINYNNTRLVSHYWSNNKWNQLTQAGIFFLQNKAFVNSDIHGGFLTNNGIRHSSSYGLYSNTNLTTGLQCISCFNSLIDFSQFSKIRFKGYKSVSSNTDIYFINSKVVVSMIDADTYISNTNCSDYVSCTMSTTSTTYELDISDWNTTGYLAIQLTQEYSSISYITDIELI